jgi:hypothetical protein
MIARNPLRITTELAVIPFSAGTPPVDLDWLACGDCHFGLETHQPDPQAPGRMLGTCDNCGRWYLILMEPDMASALMVALPETKSLHAAWDEHGGPERQGMGWPAIDPAQDSGQPPSTVPPKDEPIGDGLTRVHAP